MLDSMEKAVENVAVGHSGSVTVPTSQVGQNLAIFYDKLAQLGYNLEELKPVLESDRSMQILACAGAGKTTALTLKILRDLLAGVNMKPVALPDNTGGSIIVQRPMRILVATFLKSGADELRSSLYNWCQVLGITGISTENLVFVTLHAEFKHALDDILHMMGQPPTKLCENTDDIIRMLVNKYDIRAIDGFGKALSADEIYELTGLFTYWRNCINHPNTEHPMLQKYCIDEVRMKAIIYDFKQSLAASNMVDFEMIQEYLYEYMNMNPAIKQVLASRYDMVYIDEFQDTSELQYGILRTYFDAAKRIIAVGDDDQTIYSWRGSNIDIILSRFEADYSPDIMRLSTNYRCGENILKCVVPSIEKNTYRRDKHLKAFRKGGEVSMHLNYTVDELVTEVNEDLRKYRTIGVISRTNNDLLIPAISIILGTGADVLISKSVSIQTRMPKSVCSVIDLITKRYTSNFETILTQICGRYMQREIKQICSVLSVNGGLTLFTVNEHDLECSVPELYRTFLAPLRKAKEEGGDKFALEFIWRYMASVTFSRDNAYCNKARIFCKFMIALLTKSRYTKDLSVEGFDRLINNELPARLAKCKMPVKGKEYRIKVTTVHEAKGKEWDSVIIWADNKGTFPPRSRDKTPDDVWEEERRLHYIAWTRAKDKLSVYTIPSLMSPFLQECDLTEVGVKKDTEILNATRVAKPVNELVRKVLTDALNGGLGSLSEDIKNLVGVRSFEDICTYYCDVAEDAFENVPCTESRVLQFVTETTEQLYLDLLNENLLDF